MIVRRTSNCCETRDSRLSSHIWLVFDVQQIVFSANLKRGQWMFRLLIIMFILLLCSLLTYSILRLVDRYPHLSHDVGILMATIFPDTKLQPFSSKKYREGLNYRVQEKYVSQSIISCRLSGAFLTWEKVLGFLIICQNEVLWQIL